MLKRPAARAAGAGTLKRTAARAAGAGNLKRTAARAAAAGNNDTDDTPLPKVNIKEIMQRGIAESCTEDAFLRRGWAIGQKVALGKGLTKGTPDTPRRDTRMRKLTYSLSASCRFAAGESSDRRPRVGIHSISTHSSL